MTTVILKDFLKTIKSWCREEPERFLHLPRAARRREKFTYWSRRRSSRKL